MHRRMVRFFLVSALAVLPALSVRAEVRSVRLVRQGAGLAGGRLEAGVTVRADGLHAARSAAYVSPPLDAGLAFSAIGPH